eukprot:1156473-Pelagomonas_calceolata.AAC.1
MECKAGSCLELAQHPLNRNGSGGQEVPVCRLRLRVWTSDCTSALLRMLELIDQVHVIKNATDSEALVDE